MQQKHITELANLLESFVCEASTAMALMRGVPGADAILRKIHGGRQMPHDVEYEKVDKISWSDIKGQKYDTRTASWVLVRGDKGMGAIKAEGASYKAMAVDAEGEIDSMVSEKGGDVLDFLKSHLGKLKEFYVGKVEREYRNKIKARQERKPLPVETFSGDDNFVKLMMMKFKPIWIRSMEGAINDIKGWAQTMVKNHSFEKAKSKMDKLQRIEYMIDQLNAGKNPIDKDQYSDPFEPMRKALHNAIQMTAYHYYPDKSQGFAQPGYQHGSKKHSLRDTGATEELFNAIRDGDTKKLSTLLSFLRMELVKS